MDVLGGMRAFTRVVDEGSFTAAARALGLPKSTVSRHVAALEDHLGVRLLHRTTRTLRPTEAGQGFYQRACQILGDVDDAEIEVTQLQASPRGRLKITAGVSFGANFLGDIVADFCRTYPAIEVEISLTDRFVDLITEGYDVAIRAGRLDDSSLIARRLGSASTVICASPAYLAAHGTPRSVDDLKDHNCVRYGLSRHGSAWPLKSGSIAVSGMLTIDNGELMRALAVEGLGLAMMPVFICGRELDSGELVSVLDDEILDGGGVYAVYPDSRNLSAKVRAFVDHAAECCSPRAPWDPPER